MHVQELTIPSLGATSYVLTAGDVAAVVDPGRDTTPYLDAAASKKVRIGWVLLTHVPEDFVGGHIELAARAGARVAVSARAGAQFPHHPLSGGERLMLGSEVEIEVLATPGHSPDSVCYLARARGTGAEHATAGIAAGTAVEAAAEAPAAVLFSGDTLLLGDVGRVDHLDADPSRARERARELFASLASCLVPLSPDLPLHAAHAGGTLCCRKGPPRSGGTLGEAFQANPALGCASREAFEAWVLHGQPEVPPYFARVLEINRAGPPLLASDGGRAAFFLAAESPEAFRERIRSGAAVLDARPTADYSAGHIPGAIHVGLDGQFELWVGSAIPFPRSPGLAVVAHERDQRAVLRRLASIGWEEGAAMLEGGVDAWRAAGGELARAGQLSPSEAFQHMRSEGRRWQLVDVRRIAEWRECRAPGARHIPVPEVRARAAELDRSRPVALVCRSGYRSSVACSLLEAAGFRELYNVTGGMLAWRAEGLPTQEG